MLKKVKFYNSATGQWEIVAVAEKGDKGDKGDIGPQGPEGPQGEPGAAVKIKGTINTEDELLNINDVTKGDGYLLESNGHLHVYTGDGESGFLDVGEIRGPQGEQGPVGPQGEPGKDGVQSSSINAIEIIDHLPIEGEWVSGVLYIVIEGDE